MLVYQSIILPETKTASSQAPEQIHLNKLPSTNSGAMLKNVSLGDWGHLNIFMNPTGFLVMCVCVCVFIHLFLVRICLLLGSFMECSTCSQCSHINISVSDAFGGDQYFEGGK